MKLVLAVQPDLAFLDCSGERSDLDAEGNGPATIGLPSTTRGTP